MEIVPSTTFSELKNNLPFGDLKKKICEFLLSQKEKPRHYLGCSLLGHPCDRLLWYQYKGIFSPPAPLLTDEDVSKILKKFLRFKVGFLLEEMIIEILSDIGFQVGESQKEIELLDGKLKGHIDGIIIGKNFQEYVLEIKSMNDQRFKLLQKKNVKEGFPEYWSQCQLYMKGLKINQALFLAINKNTCEIHHEIIPYNEKDAEGLLLKAQRIFEYEEEPSIFTQSGRKIPLICYGCDYFEHCYKEQ